MNVENEYTIVGHKGPESFSCGPTFVSRSTVSWPGAPAHLLGEFRRVLEKCIFAQMRLGWRGRRHRLMAVHRPSGCQIRRNKWDTAYDRWQDRYQKISDRLRQYERVN